MRHCIHQKRAAKKPSQVNIPSHGIYSPFSRPARKPCLPPDEGPCCSLFYGMRALTPPQPPSSSLGLSLPTARIPPQQSPAARAAKNAPHSPPPNDAYPPASAVSASPNLPEAPLDPPLQTAPPTVQAPAAASAKPVRLP